MASGGLEATTSAAVAAFPEPAAHLLVVDAAASFWPFGSDEDADFASVVLDAEFWWSLATRDAPRSKWENEADAEDVEAEPAVGTAEVPSEDVDDDDEVDEVEDKTGKLWLFLGVKEDVVDCVDAGSGDDGGGGGFDGVLFCGTTGSCWAKEYDIEAIFARKAASEGRPFSEAPSPRCVTMVPCA